jgi:hypothetical protein
MDKPLNRNNLVSNDIQNEIPKNARRLGFIILMRTHIDILVVNGFIHR